MHHCNINPLSKLSSNFSFNANKKKAVAGMQPHAGWLGPRNSSKECMESMTLGLFDNRAKKDAADSFAVMIAMYIDGVLNRGAVSRSVSVPAETCEADDLRAIRTIYLGHNYR